ncbi:response regulator transcription factor [Terrihabitans sp. B22-R8]|uniref:response regulator transcription factor n=1 Tax=Terrihabitans sp. B22-R8 TaxID=3425128 RepID=UPI00403CF384
MIVIVEDDPDLRSALAFSTEIDGYQVRAYESAEDLLRANGADGSACLILDQILPGMSGLALAQHLHAAGVEVPVILMTTAPGLTLQSEAALAGLVIVEKPLLGNALIEAVQSALATHPHITDRAS